MDYLAILENVQRQIAAIADVLKDTFNADIKEMLEARLDAYINLESIILRYLGNDLTPVVTGEKP